ncbi:MAG: methyl-accepting chemotaxis protein, partial [Bacteriovorax sp.]|nr:methyl-accepting chemotaxis protein [Bacteriovorax sp.]
MKKNLPIKVKLIGLCSFFLSLILIIGVFGVVEIFKIGENLENIAEVQLPAVRKMTIADMYHDAIKSIVFQSLHFASTSTDPKLKKEIQDDIEDSTDNILKNVSEIDRLKVKDETKKAVADSLPEIKLYVENAKKIVSLALDKNMAKAEESLPEFLQHFSNLEVKLEKLATLIERDSNAVKIHSKESTQNAKKISSGLIIAGLIIGSAFSYIIINNLIASITGTVERLSESVHDVQNSGQKVNFASNKLAIIVQDQISSITETAAAMDEISAMIKQNNHSAENALNLSHESKKAAVSGVHIIEKLLIEMDAIAKSYDEIQESVSDNNNEIKKIIDVISLIANKTHVINDIVFQTKLLSFNASVEAARAGEAGKGFSVVAVEISNLTSVSGKAANDIAEMLIDSQNQVKLIAEATTSNIGVIVSSGRDKVLSGSKVTVESKEQLENILNNINQLDLTISEITAAIKEQSSGVEEVNLAMKNLENTTHNSTTITQKTKESSDELTKQSHVLRFSVQELRKLLGAKKSYD